MPARKPPPPRYKVVSGNVRELRPISHTNFDHPNHPRIQLACIHDRTREEEKYKQSAYVWAVVLCLFGGPFCLCIPFCCEGLKRVDVYCEQCNMRVRSFPGNSTKAHLSLSVILIVWLSLTIVLVKHFTSQKKSN